MACHNAGKIIVAAAHLNNLKYCYPAAFPFVYGTGIGMIKNREYFTYLGEGYINVLAKGLHQRMEGPNGQPNFFEGTSYAAAAFTAIIARMLVKNPKLSKVDLDKALRRRSRESTSMHFPVESHGRSARLTLRKVGSDNLLFPPDDDRIQRIAKDNKLSVFAMRYPVDPQNKYTFDGLKRPCIPGILSPKIFSKIDTLVLGNFLNNEILINRLFGWSLIQLFIRNNANIVVLDKYIEKVVRATIKKSMRNFSGQLSGC
jgi:hypothetical protein